MPLIVLLLLLLLLLWRHTLREHKEEEAHWFVDVSQIQTLKRKTLMVPLLHPKSASPFSIPELKTRRYVNHGLIMG